MTTRDHRGVQPHLRRGTIVALTDSSGGTASDTIADTPASYNEATLANQTASLAAKINEIIAILKEAGIVQS